MTARDFSFLDKDIYVEGLRTDDEFDYVHLGIKEVKIEKKYLPMNDSEKEYMNDKQLAFFKKVLLLWKDHLLKKTQELIETMSHNDDERIIEAVEYITEQERVVSDLRAKDRYRKLIHKIENALIKIETREYGYCEISGEIIGIPRLMIRPVATLCIQQQQLHEEEEDTKEDFEHNHQLLTTEDVHSE